MSSDSAQVAGGRDWFLIGDVVERHVGSQASGDAYSPGCGSCGL